MLYGRRKFRAVRFAQGATVRLLEKIKEEEEAIKDEEIKHMSGEDEGQNLGLEFAQRMLSKIKEDYEIALKAKVAAETEWRTSMAQLTCGKTL